MSNQGSKKKRPKWPIRTLKITEWETPAASWFAMSSMFVDMENLEFSSKGQPNVHVSVLFKDENGETIDVHWSFPQTGLSAIVPLKNEKTGIVGSFSMKMDLLKAGKDFYPDKQWKDETKDPGFKVMRFVEEYERTLLKYMDENKQVKSQLASSVQKHNPEDDYFESTPFLQGLNYQTSIQYQTYPMEHEIKKLRGKQDKTKSPVLPLKIWTGPRNKDKNGEYSEQTNGFLVPPENELVVYGEYRDFTVLQTAVPDSKMDSSSKEVKDYARFRKFVYDKTTDKGKHFQMLGRVETLGPSLYGTKDKFNLMFKVKKMIAMEIVFISMGRKIPTPEEDNEEIAMYMKYKRELTRKYDEISSLVAEKQEGETEPQREDPENNRGQKRQAEEMEKDEYDDEGKLVASSENVAESMEKQKVPLLKVDPNKRPRVDAAAASKEKDRRNVPSETKAAENVEKEEAQSGGVSVSNNKEPGLVSSEIPKEQKGLQLKPLLNRRSKGTNNTVTE